MVGRSRASWAWFRTGIAPTSISGFTCKPAIRPCGSCPSLRATASGCTTPPIRWLILPVAGDRLDHATGYARSMIQAVPGYGYVFQRLENGQYHYAALRPTHVGRRYVIFDFSVQTDPGNPELTVKQPWVAASVTSGPVPGAQ